MPAAVSVTPKAPSLDCWQFFIPFITYRLFFRFRLVVLGRRKSAMKSPMVPTTEHCLRQLNKGEACSKWLLADTSS